MFGHDETDVSLILELILCRRKRKYLKEIFEIAYFPIREFIKILKEEKRVSKDSCFKPKPTGIAWNLTVKQTEILK